MRPRILRSPRVWWSHRAPLTASLVFAVAFVALRLAYRVVFGGLPSGFDEWVATCGAVLRASAAFVAVIVFFGALNTVIDVRGALSRGLHRGPIRRLRTALVVSLAAFPAVLDSAREVRWARRMRGDRSLRSLVAPVLERSLERGVAAGASLEQRGFGITRDVVHGMCDAPVVARDVSLGFGAGWSLTVGDLRVAHGSCVLVTGDTGTGKTALLRSLTGRLQISAGGWQQGVLEVGGIDRRSAPPSETASFVSLVEQNVRDAFVASVVFDEIAFTLRMMGESENQLAGAVSSIAQRVGITHLLAREIHTLSAGEATLVALAAALVVRPSLLLLDEPLADLDEVNTQRVVEVLTAVRRETGVTMLIAEHRWDAVAELADLHVHLGSSETAAAVASKTDVSARASITPLVAPNGAGKTTWMRGFATANPTHVRLVPESPELLFSCASVTAECTHNDRLTGSPVGTTLGLAQTLMPDVPVDAHPRDLSTGQRVALACALQAAALPDLLLLDEPTRGLDSMARHRLDLMLRQLSARGTAIIFATHDAEFASAFGYSPSPEVTA